MTVDWLFLPARRLDPDADWERIAADWTAETAAWRNRQLALLWKSTVAVVAEAIRRCRDDVPYCTVPGD